MMTFVWFKSLSKCEVLLLIKSQTEPIAHKRLSQIKTNYTTYRLFCLEAKQYFPSSQWNFLLLCTLFLFYKYLTFKDEIE